MAEPQLFLFRFAVNVKSLHIVCTVPSAGGEGGGGGVVVLNFQPNLQKGGRLGRTSTFRGGCWERGDDFFQGGDAIFTHKKINI